jgi:GNAT superfamily N-acetyltransferase
LFVVKDLQLTNSGELRRKLLDIEESNFQDRSAAPEIVEAFYKAQREIIGHVPERIEGRSLAVLPEFQRMGVGKKLLAYMYARANEEQVSIFGDASKKGLPLYLATGCQLLGYVKLRARSFQLPNDAENGGGSKIIILEDIDVPTIVYIPQGAGLG